MNAPTKETSGVAELAALGEGDLEARYAALLERRAEKDAARAKEERARRMRIELLEQAMEQETGGRMGEAFAILDTSEGPIVVARGPAVLHKRFRESKMKDADVHDFVTPCVAHPDKPKFLEIVDRCPGLMVVVANALADLYMARAEVVSGKR